MFNYFHVLCFSIFIYFEFKHDTVFRIFKTVKGSKLKNKVGGGIAVGLGRSGGQETTLRTMHDFFLTHDMIVVGARGRTLSSELSIGSKALAIAINSPVTVVIVR